MRDEHSQRLADAARDALPLRWSEQRSETALRGLPARQRRRTVRRIGFTAGAASLGALLVGMTLVRNSQSQRNPLEILRLEDGTTATATQRDTRMQWASREPSRVVLALEQGGAEFAVRHDPQRVFRVEAGGVAVQVLGTRFVVERRAERVAVSVSEGRVRVFWGPFHQDLGVGEREQFPHPMALADASVPTQPTAEQTADSVPAVAVDQDASTPDRERPNRVSEPSAAELLRAADAARASGQLDRAVQLLRTASRRRAEVDAPLAAFTLGRLLDDRQDARGAAEAFAWTRTLSPRGPLAEHAMAREVVSRSRMGDTSRATRVGHEYLRLFPTGVHRSIVLQAVGSSP